VSLLFVGPGRVRTDASGAADSGRRLALPLIINRQSFMKEGVKDISDGI